MRKTGQPHRLLHTATSLLNGIGQIMLQNNPWTGLLFLAGIFCGSVPMGIAAIVSVGIGTSTAWLLQYDHDEIHEGLYGFSATLVGVALLCFFQSTIIIWAAVVVGSILATLIQHLFIQKKISIYTLPFILVVWLVLYISATYPTLIVQQNIVTSNATTNSYWGLLSRGFGQVIFQDNIWAGLLFAIGIFINRPIAMVYALAGIILSSLLAFQLNESDEDIYMGLLSYNAVLCALVFVGKTAKHILAGLVAVVLSVLIMILMRKMNLPPLTFPFVLATWLTLILKWSTEKSTATTEA